MTLFNISLTDHSVVWRRIKHSFINSTRRYYRLKQSLPVLVLSLLSISDHWYPVHRGIHWVYVTKCYLSVYYVEYRNFWKKEWCFGILVLSSTSLSTCWSNREVVKTVRECEPIPDTTTTWSMKPSHIMVNMVRLSCVKVHHNALKEVAFSIVMRV